MADHSSAQPTRSWLLPAVGILLAGMGAGALIAAVISFANTNNSASAAASATPGPASASATATQAGSVPISQLASPDWVARIATAGNIPQRAVAAYAGAALSMARTDPGCGLGWNTLAAVGQVESAHGTLNGAHLDTRGVATPTIIGAPLNGNGTARIADTDHGRYDGDTKWDHAVGPMQFIPSTWAKVAQDGNRDGVKDINQIDDAALAAAVDLCDVGGDLTVAPNWIKAISAYNDSVEYNAKVAEAATAYAKLQ